MSLIVKKAGILDTIQDAGRFGFRKFGINPNGAMDPSALRTANILLGDKECEAVVEMHFPAAQFEFKKKTSFVLTGADFDARLNNEKIAGYRVHTAIPKDVLQFKKPLSGKRVYLAVRNGFELEEWLGSKSTNLAAGVSGFEGRRLKAADVLQFAKAETVKHGFRAAPETAEKSDGSFILRFIPGPDYRNLTAASCLTVRNGNFRLRNNSDRMGYRLEGQPLNLLNDSESISSAVSFGTIQLLPDRQLIILMADHQTTGGYPNIGTIVGADFSTAGQIGPGDSVRLMKTTIEEAETIESHFEQGFSFLKTGLRLRGAWNS